MFSKKLIIFSIICLVNILFAQNRDCPDNFIQNPQYPATEPECYPENFIFYSSTSIAYYYFLNVALNDFEITDDDWVGAFKCNQWYNDECVDLGDCIGSRQWGACSDEEGCDVPVFGNDGSEYTQGYILSGEIPAFQIYDVSSDAYFPAQASDVVPWVYLEYPIIDNLNSSGDVAGCTDSQASNYDPSANIENDACVFQDYVCADNIESWSINPPDFEFSGSVSASVYIDGEMVSDQND